MFSTYSIISFFPPMRLVTKTLHPSAPALPTLSNFRTYGDPTHQIRLVKRFAHPCFSISISITISAETLGPVVKQLTHSSLNEAHHDFLVFCTG